MKRHGGKIDNQPALKKPDATDFRSKIGAKLQTLLNGFSPDRRGFPKSRRQLYKDLFGETQHSRIIIDHPTIVIKSEPGEESSNDANSLNSQNFLVSAKTRITELLNKKQDETNKHTFKDNEKENSLSSNEQAPTSTSKLSSSYTQTKAQTLLNNSFKKKRKVPCSRDNSSEPSTSKVRLKNLVVVVEDIMNTKDSTEISNMIPTNCAESENCSSDLESSSDNMIVIPEQSEDIIAKDNETKVSDSFVTIPEVECLISESCSTLNESETDVHFSTDECNLNGNNSLQNVSKSPEVARATECEPVKDSNLIPALMPLGDVFPKIANDFSCNNEDDSEFVDDPDAHQSVQDIANDLTSNESNCEALEPEVVLLCVKRPTHEVITLEDDDDKSDDIIEVVHECLQCGKAFRAKSLLNFHIRMHGNDSASPSSSSSQSCSVMNS